MLFTKNVKQAFFPFSLMVLAAGFLAFLLFNLAFTLKIPITASGKGFILMKGQMRQIVASNKGVVSKWLVEEGDLVTKSTKVALVIDANQQEHTLKAFTKGLVSEILAYKGTKIDLGQPIALVTPQGNPKKDLQVVAFVSSLVGQKITPGMMAFISPSTTSPLKNGYLKAKVSKVGKLPLALNAVQSLIKIPEITHYIKQHVGKEPFLLYLAPIKDPSNETGYAWSKGTQNFTLDSGILADIKITLEEPRAIKVIWPALFSWWTKL